MNLENVKFGLMLAGAALFIIFLFFVSYYTLYEISLNKKLRGGSKFRWSVLAFLPALGPIAYFLFAAKAAYVPAVEK